MKIKKIICTALLSFCVAFTVTIAMIAIHEYGHYKIGKDTHATINDMCFFGLVDDEFPRGWVSFQNDTYYREGKESHLRWDCVWFDFDSCYTLRGFINQSSSSFKSP